MMYRQLTEQADKYLRSLYRQDNIAGQLKLNEVRAELAVKYLEDARLKSVEIAMLLGYSNLSSFTTAFKSWYDMPPAAYRQKFLAS